MSARFIRWCWATVAMAIAFNILFTLNFSTFYVSGSSMEPALSDGDLILFNKDKEFERGQLVLFQKPISWPVTNQIMGNDVVKRIVAVPGDRLEFQGRGFTVNGLAVSPLLPETPCSAPNYSEIIPEGQLFVLGDNRSVSLDSQRVYCLGVSSFLVPVELVESHGHVTRKLP